LQQVAESIVDKGKETDELRDLFTSFRANTPWLFIDLDRTAARTKMVAINEVFNTFQVYLGSLYVNDFNRFGRTWQVNLQADTQFRRRIDDLKQLRVRSSSGKMVPFGSLARVREVTGPVMISRYNMYLAAAVNVTPEPGVSSGQAIEHIEEVVQPELARSM